MSRVLPIGRMLALHSRGSSARLAAELAGRVSDAAVQYCRANTPLSRLYSTCSPFFGAPGGLAGAEFSGEERRRPAFFDYNKAWEKYGGTEWESLLDIDKIEFRRDRYEAQAMLDRTFSGAARSRVGLPATPIPGRTS
eukprot:SAG22_NODE_1002_length_6052_cov_3.257558_5_plen_138_part_00